MISSSGNSGDAPLPDGLSGSLPGSQHSTPRRSKSYNDMQNAGIGPGEPQQEDDEDLPDMNSSFTGRAERQQLQERGSKIVRDQCNWCRWVFAKAGRFTPTFHSTEISIISSGVTVIITYIIMLPKIIDVVLCS